MIFFYTLLCYDIQVKIKAQKFGITDEQELMIVLQFYHDVGTIIYFGSEKDTQRKALKDIVIYDPQWLIDIFRKVITVLPDTAQVKET